ncbi:MAG: LamG-like jellyroll fold domain-containing protein [Verrucomicrobiota bacterium JB022]|nr:LamG-like jellyroll fold domain-containing protein [Verrucomicrobiota bacterium JB022]
MKLNRLFFAVGAMLTPFAMQAAAPTAGLLAHWTFDDTGSATAIDATGNGHDAMLVGGAEQVADGMKYGALRTYDADDGAIWTSTDSPQITITAWVKPGSETVFPQNPRVVETNGYRFFVSYDEYKVDLVFEQDFKTGGGQARAKWRIVLPYNYAETWMHVGVSFDRTNVANAPTFYVNGAPETKILDHVPPPAAGNAIGYSFRASIGNNPQLYRGYQGYIDEIRIYNRILSGSEVNDIYEEDYPFFFFPGLVDIGGGLHDLPFYGIVDISSFPDVWHQEHGWLNFAYLTLRPDDEVYTAYDQKLRWIVFSRNNYPRIYSYTLDDDLEYHIGTDNPRVFTNLEDMSILNIMD